MQSFWAALLVAWKWFGSWVCSHGGVVPAQREARKRTIALLQDWLHHVDLHRRVYRHKRALLTEQGHKREAEWIRAWYLDPLRPPPPEH